jgi:hypothetical protein
MYARSRHQELPVGNNPTLTDRASLTKARLTDNAGRQAESTHRDIAPRLVLLLRPNHSIFCHETLGHRTGLDPVSQRALMIAGFAMLSNLCGR